MFLKGRLEEAHIKLDQFHTENLDSKNRIRLMRVMNIMFLGEIYGLHTLKSILDVFQIKSTNLYRIWKGHDYRKIQDYALNLSNEYFKDDLQSLLGKSDSSLSRSNLTIVIDDSIFKQWLSNEEIGGYFAKFFSGQTHSTVYGFRVNMIGVAIGESFYPLHFELVPKGSCTKQAALKQLRKVKATIDQVCESQALKCPQLFLSVDSGFTDTDLIEYCEKEGIAFIGVLKRTHVIKIGKRKANVKTHIETEYLEKEKRHIESYEAKGETPPPFMMRKKAYFQAEDRDVILLFFRLNGSNKVTVIYCTEYEVKGKTIRRRFFQRTKIELFFRFLKDTLKIQKSKSVDYESFVKKLSLFIMKALICFQFEQMCRRRFRVFKGWSFTKLRRHIIYQQVNKDYLKSLVENRGFCKAS